MRSTSVRTTERQMSGYSCPVLTSDGLRRARGFLVLTCTVLVAFLTGAVSGSASAAPAAPQVPVAACGGIGGKARPNASINRSVTVGGVTRTFRVHLPASYDGRHRQPMILGFHGHAEKSTSFEQYTQLSRLPAVVVYPDGLRGLKNQPAWQGAPYSSPASDDVAFTRAILRDVRSTSCVDAARTFAVGRSNGGGFVALLSCRLPSEFAAFATVDAAVYTASMSGCASAPPVSVIDFHGTDDRVISYDGGVRFGAPYLSSRQWLDSLVRRGHCAPVPVTIPINRHIQQVTWPFCAPGVMITHSRIVGGSHRWPGSTGNPGAGPISDTISASHMIWAFFVARTALR